MAVQKNVLLSGRVGKYIFYVRNGTYCVRAVPGKVKQTKATKARAKEFGKAARIGATLRNQLYEVIPFPADNSMQTRLLSAILEWLKESGDSRTARIQNLDMVRGFQFTSVIRPMTARFKVKPAISILSADSLQIKIPGFSPTQSISAPAHTVSVKLKITAGKWEPGEDLIEGEQPATLLYDYNSKPVAAQILTFEFPMPKEGLVVVGASLEYTVMKNGRPQINKNKAFMPAGIIEAFYI